jgi:hypothetical protein
MSRRKKHSIPAEHSYHLVRSLELAKKRAWELAHSPWLAKYDQARASFLSAFHEIARTLDLVRRQHEVVLESSQAKE